MGKQYKRKRRSCALCKPHKMGWDKKRTPQQAALLKTHEKEMGHDYREDDRLVENAA